MRCRTSWRPSPSCRRPSARRCWSSSSCGGTSSPRTRRRRARCPGTSLASKPAPRCASCPRGSARRTASGTLSPVNVVFLSPHFPPGMHLYVQRLREAGATVLGIADVAYEALRPELRAALTEYYRVDDLHSIDQLTRAVGYFTHRYGKVDRLESLNEY